MGRKLPHPSPNGIPNDRRRGVTGEPNSQVVKPPPPPPPPPPKK
jgi:hypothetical protein